MGLEIWNKLKAPPASALKQINAGRLKGMSDINPQWRYEALTSVFGLCGDCWKYEIKRLWTEQGTDGQVFAFAEVLLFVKISGEWSSPIPGIGGSMLITKEKNGLYNSDEAFKMALTDALSVSMKMIGVGADIYRGRWDGFEYKKNDEELNDVTEIWKSNVETASKEISLEDYRKWWGEHKKEIEHDCGTAGAAKVYAHYVSTGKEIAKLKVAA